jgi:hypothetical protein
VREGNSDDNVFRFNELRPAGPAEEARSRERRHHDRISTPGRPHREMAGEPEAGLLGTEFAERRGLRFAVRPQVVSELAAKLMQAHDELRPLITATALNVPDSAAFDPDRAPLALSKSGEAQLSPATLELLAECRISIEDNPIHEVSEQLESLIAQHAADTAYAPLPPAEPTEEEEDPPHIRSVGVADLLLVKQHIKRYEPGEIAHIENVLARELKKRVHRDLNRTEETFLFETERIQERESELEKTDRFELNQESSRTQEVDRQTGFGLTLSGKYGPSVEFTSNLDVHTDTTTQSSQTTSVSYARDVIERSRERIVDRVRTQRTTTILREIEEINEHAFDNTTSAAHVVGIYQFVDKIYETQIFNYGIRQMFDFMIPEPASFVWLLESHPPDTSDFPVPPIPLEADAPDASFINGSNYLILASRYGAEPPKLPPPLFRKARSTLNQGMTSDASESDQPRSVTKTEMDVPDGYRPVFGFAKIAALTDTDESNTPAFAISVGEASKIVVGDASTNQPVGEHDYFLVDPPLEFFDISSAPTTLVDNAKLPMQVVAFESANYSVNVLVIFGREDAYAQWQINTYDQIAEAYQRQLADYEQRLAAAQSRVEAEAQSEETTIAAQPPSVNERVIRRELRRHCVSILRREGFDMFNSTEDTYPPVYDFDEAEEEGREVRFFEQAFEWDQMQYVFYPYFWGRVTTWGDRFSKTHADPAYVEFLQAGSARAVIPVRPGFEEAVCHYLSTHELWNGEEDQLEITDQLYVDIVDEIKERTGASQEEIPVGDAWETRVPTSLVLLRQDGSLPSWKRLDTDSWEWTPNDSGSESDGVDGGDA